MDDWKELLRYLPRALATTLKAVDPATVREVRLRKEQPLVLSTAAGDYLVTRNGELTLMHQASVLTVSETDMEETVLRLCGYAVHTHQEELRHGFITTDSGVRVGVGGTVAIADGEPITVGAITSLCLRVSRTHDGCSAEICKTIQQDGRLGSVLIGGQPSSGKTSLLRDMAKRLSEGADGRRWRVTVVDERGELSYGGGLGFCDVIRGCPKAEGIRRAIRLFAPDIVIFDEWGTPEETAAVMDALPCGVAIAASCHTASLLSLTKRSVLWSAVVSGFEWLVELTGNHRPGRWNRIVKVGDLCAEMDRDRAGGGDLPADRQSPDGDTAGTGADMGTECATGDDAGFSHPLHGAADTAAVEGIIPDVRPVGAWVSAASGGLSGGGTGERMVPLCRGRTDRPVAARSTASGGVWRSAGADGCLRPDGALSGVRGTV